MRIIAGTHRGARLAALGSGDNKARLRPTSDRLREALFNLLSGGRFGDVLADAHVLDVFAGTGALGLEALSRGAAQARFLDNGRVSQRLIAQNIEQLKLGERVTQFRIDATRPGPAPGAHSLVFLDPPYGKELGQIALAALADHGWIAPGAVVVLEDAREIPPPVGFEPVENRRYGGTTLSIFRAGFGINVP